MDSDLQPGRELDALIAQRFTKAKPPKRTAWNDEAGFNRAYEAWLKRIPRYSTDIAAAWSICDHMNNKDTDPVKAADFYEALEEHGPLFFFSGEKTAHIICLAALKTVRAS